MRGRPQHAPGGPSPDRDSPPLALACALTTLLLAVAGCALEPGTGSADAAREESSTRPADAPRVVSALGRLEPKNGIRRLAGPSRPSVVIAKLLVDQGDRVAEGQPIAVLDTEREDEARVARMGAQLGSAQRLFDRAATLMRQGVSSAVALDEAKVGLEVARADLEAAQAALALDTVRAPVAGEVVVVHARSGERIGPDGILEIAENDQMYAVAEVYETDIGRIELGQVARLRSPALNGDLTGTVDRIGRKIGRQEALDTDPVARTDARVVEVRIKLDESTRAAALSNLQVEVTIEPK
ncbi:MAG: HlyD family efflux transporter periplasmic adaptor subunit [Deltaproteobacteria bacterium]|nr:HlyD family efflux transporter periplasmic adaptor subunit [Deltaproteobacteria bacterium]